MKALGFLSIMKRIIQCNMMMKGWKDTSPYYITFNCSYRCQSRCSSCGIWKIYIKDPELRPKELSLGEIDKIFKEIPAPLWLTLSGGEPFLRGDLLEICESAHKNYPNLYGLGVLTNGLLPEKFVRFIDDLLCVGFSNVKASVSIDGMEKMNDKMRGVKGSYKKALKTYVMLKEIANQRDDFTVVISRTVSPMNAGTLHSFNGNTINDLYISIAQNGIAFNNLDYEFNTNKEAILSDLNFLLENADFKGLYKKIKRVFTKKCKSFIENPRMILPCSAFTASCLIDPFGNVYPCTIWAKKMGSLRSSSFKEIWTSENAEATRKLIKNKSCPLCWSGCEATHCILQALLSLKAPKLMYEMFG